MAFGLSRQRLQCAINGHHWADRPYTLTRNREDRKILVVAEECERDGCERVRTTYADPKTFDILYRHYGGDQSAIPLGTTRAELRRELYRSQK